MMKSGLPPCHTLFQFMSAKEVIVSALSKIADLPRVPYNIASYALLTYMIASVTGLKVGDFVIH